jgi:transcription initiation factor TFIID subunit 5
MIFLINRSWLAKSFLYHISHSVFCVALPCSFHPNCSYLLSGSSDRTVRMWSVAEGRCVRILTGHKGAVTSLQVSPCGRLAATAGEDKRIKIWDLAEGKWIKVSCSS